jgi:hypothetical protein
LEAEFDLLISLYASAVSHSCKRYLKVGGLLLTNNFQEEALKANNDPQLKLISVIPYRKNSYTLMESNLAAYLTSQSSEKTKKYLKQTSNGVEYVEIENYFVFRRNQVGD